MSVCICIYIIIYLRNAHFCELKRQDGSETLWDYFKSIIYHFKYTYVSTFLTKCGYSFKYEVQLQAPCPKWTVLVCIDIRTTWCTGIWNDWRQAWTLVWKTGSLPLQLQQRPESPTVTLIWHACKYKVHDLYQRYILFLQIHKAEITPLPEQLSLTSPWTVFLISCYSFIGVQKLHSFNDRSKL